MSTSTKIFNSFLTNFFVNFQNQPCKIHFSADAMAIFQGVKNDALPQAAQKQQRKILLLPTFCYIIFISEIQIYNINLKPNKTRREILFFAFGAAWIFVIIIFLFF